MIGSEPSGSFPRSALDSRYARALLASLLLVLVGAAGGCTSGESAERAPPGRAAAHGTRVVFADRNDLWLWEATDGRTRRLTWNALEPAESQPRFSSPGRVTYIADGSLYTLALATGRRRLVVPTRAVLAFAWSPGRDTLAYVVQAGGVGPHALYFFRPGEKRTSLVRRFLGPAPPAGESDGGVLPVDRELSLEWSAAGTRILLVDTDLGPTEPTVYVFGADGRERERLRAATHAGWIGEDRFYSRTLRGGVWSISDLRRRTRSRLKIALGRMHPALSPDRRLLAFDSGRPWRPGTRRRGCACTLSLFDLVTGRERRLGTGFVAPLWLARRSLAATEARACSGAECGVGVPMWVARKRSARLGADTGERTQISLRSTLDADVFFAP